jgi:hypothetical protein
MNSATSITLIVVGALLILIPLFLGVEAREHAMNAYSAIVASGHAIEPHQAVRRGGGRLYVLICLIAGLACLITGILRSRQPHDSHPPAPMVHGPAG